VLSDRFVPIYLEHFEERAAGVDDARQSSVEMKSEALLAPRLAL
jgi:hypothetical protein